MADDSKKDEKPPPPLDESNWAVLAAVTIANLAAFGVVAGLDPKNLHTLAVLLPAGIGLAAVRVVRAQFPAWLKHALVYWWSPRPGSCYDDLGANDDRVSMAHIKEAYGPVPAGPAEKNQLWYGIYLKFQDRPSVIQANRNYLFTRDYAEICIVLFITLGIGGFLIADPGAATWYAAALLVQYLVVRNAAHNYGVEVVTNVLALASHAAKTAGAPKGPEEQGAVVEIIGIEIVGAEDSFGE